MSRWKRLFGTYNSDGDSAAVRIDSATDTLQTIEYEHHEIHSGSHFFIENDVVLGDTEVLDIVALTPDTEKWIHVVWDVQGQGEFMLQVYEGGVINAWDGTDITAHNSNRNSSNTTDLVQFQLDPDITSDGDLLYQVTLGSATTPVKGIPGGGQRDHEIILKQGTMYIWRITSGLAANSINYNGNWYEHTNKH